MDIQALGMDCSGGVLTASEGCHMQDRRLRMYHYDHDDPVVAIRVTALSAPGDAWQRARQYFLEKAIIRPSAFLARSSTSSTLLLPPPKQFDVFSSNRSH